eukprot:3120416-Rhodomonas_salina.1
MGRQGTGGGGVRRQRHKIIEQKRRDRYHPGRDMTTPVPFWPRHDHPQYSFGRAMTDPSPVLAWYCWRYRSGRGRQSKSTLVGARGTALGLRALGGAHGIQLHSQTQRHRHRYRLERERETHTYTADLGTLLGAGRGYGSGL